MHRFPGDMPAGESLTLTLGGVAKGLLDTNARIVMPFKKPKDRRHERFAEVEMDFGCKFIAHEARINFTTSEILVFGRLASPLILQPQLLTPVRSTLKTYYERKGKRKLLHAFFQGPGLTFFNIDRVFEFYDRVYCVDTNTAVGLDGIRIAVTTALTMTTRRIGENALNIKSDNTIQLVAKNPPPGNPELHGIWSLLGFLYREHRHLLEGRLAIITDTEFGKVKSWNDRTETFYDGHHLPGGVDIFYASADGGSQEFMPNHLMTVCDSLSTKKLQELRAAYLGPRIE